MTINKHLRDHDHLLSTDQESDNGFTFLECETHCESFNGTVATVWEGNQDFLWRVVVDEALQFAKRLGEGDLFVSFFTGGSGGRWKDPFVRWWLGVYRARAVKWGSSDRGAADAAWWEEWRGFVV